MFDMVLNTHLKKHLNDTALKDVRNLFRLKKENKAIKNRVIGDIKNLFRLAKENKEIKNRVIRVIRKLSEHEEENYYKPLRVRNFWLE